LDHFKKTNDSLGHNIGDELLKSSAKRLQSIMRQEDLVARLGGDEFVMLLNNLGEDLSHAITLAEEISDKIHHIMERSFDLNGHTLNVSTSIGISILNSSKETPNDLLKYADTAMYQSKKDGRSKSSFYQDEMNIELKRRLNIENILRGAIDNGELELYYQPMIAFTTKELMGAEALIRLHSKDLGDIYPDEFIPIAEETGLILSIGEWILERAILDFLEWNKLYTDYSLETIAINISTKQFSNDNFIELIKNVIYKTKVDPKCVELELTESIIIKDIKESVSKMNELRQMGIGISIDDFGTGYSSLSYLRMLPFSSLKIDRSFTQDIEDEQEEKKLINSIISIAKSFNMQIVAEGIENDIQYNYLAKRECDYFQGYFCSKPINAKAFEEFIKKKYNTDKNTKSKV
ncbi:MAG: phosphodiesterase, partial [Campylobacterota bacterium]|nr:phosphodiesterase [Campylobacterota bacterium]